MCKKTCELCGKEVDEKEMVWNGRYDNYIEGESVWHPECLEKEYEYNEENGYM